MRADKCGIAGHSYIECERMYPLVLSRGKRSTAFAYINSDNDPVSLSQTPAKKTSNGEIKRSVAEHNSIVGDGVDAENAAKERLFVVKAF